MAEPLVSARLGKRPQRDAQPDIDQDVPLEVKGPGKHHSELDTSQTEPPTKKEDLCWIVGGSPDDFKSRDTMRKVRKAAMVSYLKTGNSKNNVKSGADSKSSTVSPHSESVWQRHLVIEPRKSRTSSFVDFSRMNSQQPRNSFSDALDASRGMVSLSQLDITPRNIHGTQGTSSTESYGFPSTHSAHSSISSASYGHNGYNTKPTWPNASSTLQTQDFGLLLSKARESQRTLQSTTHRAPASILPIAHDPYGPDPYYFHNMPTINPLARLKLQHLVPIGTPLHTLQDTLQVSGPFKNDSSSSKAFNAATMASDLEHAMHDLESVGKDTARDSRANLREVRNNERASLTNATSVEDGNNEIDRYYSESITSSPSYASSVASVFSLGSLASSATDLSRSSRYSAMQIASATKVLLSVFQEDASLLLLYQNAMDDPHIGPGRLRRNLRRIFKAYAQQLEAEATELLEFLTSRLVMMKSGFLADSIVHLVSNDEHKDESSGEDDDGSSEAYPVNEEAFEDLDVFRKFLIKSEAFQDLQTQVRVFVMGKPTQILDTSAVENEKLPAKDAVQQCLAMSATQSRRSLAWKNWIEDVAQTIDGLLRGTSTTNTVNFLLFLFTDAFMLATDGILVALGQLEPALKPGMTRLRWRCSCGDRLYSDVLELRADGISELKDHMQRTSGIKVHVSSYDERNTVQQYITPRPLIWIQNAGKKIWATLGRTTQLSTLLPLHNTQCHANASTTPTNKTSSTLGSNASSASNYDASYTSNGNISSTSSGNASSTSTNDAPHQNMLRLLACMHRDRDYVGLVQDPLENITTDRTLLCFLRRQYICHRGSILRMISLKSIKGLYLVKFWLTKGGKVIVGHHERYCVATSSASMSCECLPPVSRVEPSPGAEYRCRPVPAKTTPPIPPEWLSSLITCPTDMDEDDDFILNQLPKRTRGKLAGQIGEPVEGWGVYYQEAWDHDMIMWAIFILLVVASLLFGVLWSRFKMDIQGAFSVSAWITGVCGAFLAVVANYADKKR